MIFKKKSQFPNPHPADLTIQQKWFWEVLMEHGNQLGEIRGVLKITIPLIFVLLGAIIAVQKGVF